MCEQAVPPHWRLLSTERLRDWELVPHDLKQGQLPKPCMTHATGQHWVLQARVSATWPWARAMAAVVGTANKYHLYKYPENH